MAATSSQEGICSLVETGTRELETEDIQDLILPQAYDVRAKTKSVPSKPYQSRGVFCSDPKMLYQILQKSQQADSSSQSILEENCLSVGLELHGDTPADGNCFFEAVSSQLRRLNCVVQKSPQQLRQEVVAFMKINRVIQASEGTIHLDSFICDESFDTYCSHMARDSEWADPVVVVAMARMLQIDIMIVTSSPSSGPEDIIVWVVGQTAFQEDPILLGHVWESHYMSLQPIVSDIKCQYNYAEGTADSGDTPSSHLDGRMPRKIIMLIERYVKTYTDNYASHTPYFNGIVVIEDKLVVIDDDAWNLQLYNCHDGTLISISDKQDSRPYGVCLISKTEVGVCLSDCTIKILPLKSINDKKLVKMLKVTTGFHRYYSVAKLNSDKLAVSGWKCDGMFCWGIVSITDKCLDSTHDICKGDIGHTHLAISKNTIYISCLTSDFITTGVYAYDIHNPHTQKFFYPHQELKEPGSIMAVRDYVYVCDYDRIHQLTDSGQLVTIHTVSSSVNGIFYDDQHEVLYTTSYKSNVITVYKMEYLYQPGIPTEILEMDERSIQLFEEALKDGKETVHSLRIMVVGNMGVGKTTLVKRLLGEEVNISERHGTEDIDVSVNCCDVSLSTHEWTRRTKDSDQDYQLQRLVKILNENYQTRDSIVDSEQGANFKKRERTDITSMSYNAYEDKNIEILYTRTQEQNFGQNLSSTASQQEESHFTVVATMPGSELGKNVATESHKIDPLREMLKLLQQNPIKAKQDVSKYAYLKILDFAGQYAFYSTHQMFLTRRAIYLLVSDASRGVSDIVKDDVEAWMNSIHSCVLSGEENLNSASSQTSSCKVLPPPVMLVGTHIDQIPQGYQHREYGQRYLQDIRSYLSDKRARVHLVDEDFAIDNTVLDSKLEELKKKIVEVASQQPYWGEQIPTRWFLLEQQLMKLRDAGVKVVSHSTVENLNKEGTVRIEESEELDLFLRYLHETGTIIYFSIEVLRDNVVLDRKWMIDSLKFLINAHLNLPNYPADNDTESNARKSHIIALEYHINALKSRITALKSFIDDPLNLPNYPADNNTESNAHKSLINALESYNNDCENLINTRESLINAQLNLPNRTADNDTESNAAQSNIMQKWSDFKEKGILTVELVDAIWTKEKHSDLHEHKDHILMIMEQLNILFRARSFNEMGEMVENYFLIPCMLRQESPKEVISPEEDPRMVRTPDMCCIFTGKYLPTPIFHRLLAACVTRWPVAKKKETSENLIFFGCCVFDLDLFHRLTVYIKNHVVFARITRMVVDEVKTPDAKLCSRVRRFITLNLSKITSCLGQNLQFELQAAVESWHADKGHDDDAPIIPEHMNQARLCVAIITVCGNAMREILSTQVPSPYTDIHQAIVANKSKLTSRQGRPLLNLNQSKLVFPDPLGKITGTVDQFDLSILYILIRCISTVPPPVTGWGYDPQDQPRDSSLGASVERIRSFRNHIFGHSSYGKISQHDFDDYWNKIDAVLDDIEVKLGRQGYRAQLEKQKTQVISIYQAC